MKRTTILFSAALAAAIATLAGCNPTGSSEQTIPMARKVTEVRGGKTYITEFTYKPNSVDHENEVQTLNGVPVYERTYTGTYDNNSYVQTNYGEGGEKTYQRSTPVVNGNKLTVSIYAISSESDTSTGTLVESVETTYIDGTRNYSEAIHTRGGTVVSRDFDFDYTNFKTGVQYPYYTYKRSEEGGEPVTMCFYGNKLNIYGEFLEYTIYKNWVDATTKGDVVESKTEYSAEGSTDSYTMKTINKDTGLLETTKVTTDYINITVRYN